MKIILNTLMAFIVIFITSCSSSRVMITGVALDAKAGAVIITNEQSVYYIQDIYRWDAKFLRKTVIVHGRRIKRKTFKDKGPWYQGPLEKNIIIKPRIELVSG